MSVNLGYAISSIIFIGIFVVAVAAQIRAKAFHPFLYWFVIIATTTAGTTMADFADRSLGIGYPGGALILFVFLMAALGIWYWSAGSVSVNTVTTPRIEAFYWAVILFSQTLGTALGDWMADTNGLVCVPKTSSDDDFGFGRLNSLCVRQNSQLHRNNSLFLCVGNFRLTRVTSQDETYMDRLSLPKTQETKEILESLRHSEF